MNKLLSTTALAVALGFPSVSLAQTTASATQADSQVQNDTTSAFIAERGQSDIFASELIGHDVYARRANNDQSISADGQTHSDDQQNTQGDQSRMNANNNRAMPTMNRDDLENMEQIGQINEIVLTDNGQVPALVIGVGGFLGLGEQDIAVSMDQVTFATDVDDPSLMYIMLHTAADTLQNAPSYDRNAARGETRVRDESQRGQIDASGDSRDNAESRTSRTGFAAPQMEREGYNRVEVGDVSTEMLMGKSVYDVQDNDVGTVDDMILDDDGRITNIIINFGGFLGLGSSQAAIGFDELTIMSDEGYSDVRIYVDATKDQIQELPRYSASN